MILFHIVRMMEIVSIEGQNITAKNKCALKPTANGKHLNPVQNVAIS